MKNIITKFTVSLVAIFVLFGVVTTTHAAGNPNVSTQAVSNITATSATLNGFYSDNGSAMTQVYFDYGLSPKLGFLSSFGSIGGSSSNFSVTVSGLTPGTTYYVQAVGVNGEGATWGTPMVSFKTLAASTTNPTAKPTISTQSASSIGTSSATLNGFYNMNNDAGTVWFEYGTSSSSLSSSTSQNSVGSNSGNFNRTITGLSSNTTYYFRAVGENSLGRTYGTPIVSFTTDGSGTPANQCVLSLSASQYIVNSGNAVILTWNTTNCTNISLTTAGNSLNASGTTTVYPQTTTTYYLTGTGSQGTISTSVTITVDNYNNNGGNYNNTPSVTTYNPTNITATSATLSGYAYGGYAQAVTVWFEYGQNGTFTYTTPAQSVYGSGTVTAPVNLSPNNMYQYRLVARNSYGTQFGNTVMFSTIQTTQPDTGGPYVYDNGTVNPPVVVRTYTNYTNPGTSVLGSNNGIAIAEADTYAGNGMLAAVGYTSTFLPDTFVEWLLLIVVILAIIVISRNYMKKD